MRPKTKITIEIESWIVDYCKENNWDIGLTTQEHLITCIERAKHPKPIPIMP